MRDERSLLSYELRALVTERCEQHYEIIRKCCEEDNATGGFSKLPAWNMLDRTTRRKIVDRLVELFR